MSLQSVPIRWRLAGICAGLTAAILIVFAIVLGSLVGNRIRDDFRTELRSAASTLASETEVDRVLGGRVVNSPRLEDFGMANHAAIRVLDRGGAPIDGYLLDVDLGPPQPSIARAGNLQVATEPIVNGGQLTGFVQFGRSADGVEATVDRVWLFLAAGVLGGMLMAAFAGLAVADRAMRPISSLTSLARDIAKTRDPSRRMPVTDTDDEVGELARTMDEMLEALDQARTEREHAFDRQREFVADASHELRTPLTSVLANLEMLNDGKGLSADDRHAIESALGSTRRMGRLVGDLALLARADAGRLGSDTDFDLAATCTAALEEVRPIANGHEIESAIEAPLPVTGDRDGMHRVVLNLLENAVRHTPPGTPVRLETARAGDRARIVISDEGPGLPPGPKAELFGRFVRGPGPADISGHEGSGLGLAIVRAVALAHGGSVKAESNGGASFTVELPLAGLRSR